ncbi:MAG: hypothetical protein JRG92_04660 [Deltaproteobacteria bacterium]|nr:hypothetical protein [Deltaproteobacteria bacterium]
MQNDNRISKLMLAIAAALLVALVGYSAATAEAAETAASAVSDPWEATGDESAGEDADRVIGRVVGLRGRVYAARSSVCSRVSTTPAWARTRLSCTRSVAPARRR